MTAGGFTALIGAGYGGVFAHPAADLLVGQEPKVKLPSGEIVRCRIVEAELLSSGLIRITCVPVVAHEDDCYEWIASTGGCDCPAPDSGEISERAPGVFNPGDWD